MDVSADGPKDKEAARQAFARWLRDVRRDCGNPTYRQICRAGDLAPASVSRLLRADTWPTWWTVLRFLDGCGAARDEKVLNETKRRWKELDQLRYGDAPAPDNEPNPSAETDSSDEPEPSNEAEPVTGQPEGVDCPECALYVRLENLAVHLSWHQTQRQAALEQHDAPPSTSRLFRRPRPA